MTETREISPSPWGRWRQGMDAARTAEKEFNHKTPSHDRMAYNAIKESLSILDTLGEPDDYTATQIADTLYRSAESNGAKVPGYSFDSVRDAADIVVQMCGDAYALGVRIAAAVQKNDGVSPQVHADELQWAHRSVGILLRVALHTGNAASRNDLWDDYHRALTPFINGTLVFPTIDEYDRYRSDHLAWLELLYRTMENHPSLRICDEYYALVQGIAECVRRSDFTGYHDVALRFIAEQGRRGTGFGDARRRQWAAQGFRRRVDRHTAPAGAHAWIVDDDLQFLSLDDQRSCLETGLQIIAAGGDKVSARARSEFDAACVALLGSDYKGIASLDAQQLAQRRVVRAVDKGFLVFARHEVHYDELAFVKKDTNSIRDALGSYAAGIDPTSILAIDETAPKTWYRTQSQGVIFTDRFVCSSYLPENSRIIPYLGIVSTYHDVLRAEIRLKNGTVVDAHWGPHADQILDMLDLIARAMTRANSTDTALL